MHFKKTIYWKKSIRDINKIVVKIDYVFSYFDVFLNICLIIKFILSHMKDKVQYCFDEKIDSF